MFLIIHIQNRIGRRPDDGFIYFVSKLLHGRRFDNTDCVIQYLGNGFTGADKKSGDILILSSKECGVSADNGITSMVNRILYALLHTHIGAGCGNVNRNI